MDVMRSLVGIHHLEIHEMADHAELVGYSISLMPRTAYPPPLGAQSGEVLAERLGLSAADMEILRAKGVV